MCLLISTVFIFCVNVLAQKLKTKTKLSNDKNKSFCWYNISRGKSFYLDFKIYIYIYSQLISPGIFIIKQWFAGGFPSLQRTPIFIICPSTSLLIVSAWKEKRKHLTVDDIRHTELSCFVRILPRDKTMNLQLTNSVHRGPLYEFLVKFWWSLWCYCTETLLMTTNQGNNLYVYLSIVWCNSRILTSKKTSHFHLGLPIRGCTVDLINTQGDNY